MTKILQEIEPACPAAGCLAVFGIFYEFSPLLEEGDGVLETLFADIPTEINKPVS